MGMQCGCVCIVCECVSVCVCVCVCDRTSSIHQARKVEEEQRLAEVLEGW